MLYDFLLYLILKIHTIDFFLLDRDDFVSHSECMQRCQGISYDGALVRMCYYVEKVVFQYRHQEIR